MRKHRITEQDFKVCSAECLIKLLESLPADHLKSAIIEEIKTSGISFNGNGFLQDAAYVASEAYIHDNGTLYLQTKELTSTTNP